jgi:hypothetical protein
MYAKLSGGVLGAFVLLLAAAPARADLAAVYAQGHGGNSSAAGVSDSGLGYRLGARLLIFEGYFDHTGFGQGVGINRGIFGLRVGIGPDRVRLVLRAGGGVVEEKGGALTGPGLGIADRRGPVGRIGAAVDVKLAPMFYAGAGIDAETFRLPAVPGAAAVIGSDVFLNLHLLFEVGL